MSSSWKRRAFEAAFVAALAAGAFAPVRPAAAATCSETPVAEQGGKHWCYKHDATKGNVHLWTSPGYDPTTAITVIYIHGLDSPKFNNGPDTCRLKRPYVDCIWDASDANIVGQFAASGVNGLFVAVEGGPETYPLWNSLGSLLTSIKDKGKIAAPETVTVVAHSAGMYTAKGLWGDNRVKHLVPLDWLKGLESPPLHESVKDWYNGNDRRRLTIVSGSSNQTVHGTTLADALKDCVTVTGPTTLTQEQISVRCLHMKSMGGGLSSGHMGVVYGQKAIPLAIKRSLGVEASAPKAPSSNEPSAPPTSGGAQPDKNYKGPLLEIPIPNVDFTDAVRQNGEITIPWLAQYIGGVYTFLVSIVGIVAAVSMVVGGFQYVTSGGDQGKIGAGKKRIVNALSGLLLALGSYTILYAINPDLVRFEGLKIASVRTEFNFAENDAADVIPPPPSAPKTPNAPPQPEGGNRNATLPSGLCHSEATCAEKYCIPGESSWPKTIPGIMDPGLAVRIPTITGLAGKGFSASQQVVDLLKKAAGIAVAIDPKYRIEVGDAYRPLRRQFELACPHVLKKDGRTGGYVAWPGGSLHGAGFAVDLHFYKGTTELTKGNSTPLEYSVLLDKIMFEAGFRRYTAELWHYEPKDAPYVNGCRCVYPNCPHPPPPASDCTKGGGYR